MSITIDGTIVAGIGGATPRLQQLWPWLTSQFHVIAGCHRGTINVQLDRPLRVNHPHYTTAPSPPPHPEQFSFLMIDFECPVDTNSRKAWILIPQWSPHIHNLFHVELLAEFIQTVGAGVLCRLRISDEHTTSEVLIV
jgi:hypothetical protein